MSNYYTDNNNHNSRPYINVITDDDVEEGRGKDEESINPMDYCIFCHVKLSYSIYENVLYCENCGWKFPSQQHQQQPQPQPITTTQQSQSTSKEEAGGGAPIMAGGRNDNDDDDYYNNSSNIQAYDDDIPVYSMQPRSKQVEDRIRKMESPGLDDELRNFLHQKNARLVRSEEYLPTTQEENMSERGMAI